MAHVARQKPDGQTLLMALSSIVVIPESDKVSGRAPRYTMQQFTPIALITADPTVLVVRADSPYRTIDDLMRDAKARPGAISYSSSGIYGTTHLCQSMLWQNAGVHMLHVPFNGGGPSLTALLGRQVDLTAQAPGTVAPHLKSGAVRILGTWGAERLALFPEVRTFREQGFDVIAGVARSALPEQAKNFLRTVLDNGRLLALPEIATQFRALVNAQNGSTDAVVHSAFPLDAQALADLQGTLERRFGRKLNLSVQVDESLIGGIRVVAGDEVLDTSVQARLQQMKAALTA